MTIEDSIRCLVRDIAIACKGATNHDIRGQEYADNAVLLDRLITELARLHPYWSEERGTLLGWAEGLTPITGDASNPVFLLFQRTEALWWAWKNMRAANPSIYSLMEAVPEFSKALESLIFTQRILD